MDKLYIHDLQLETTIGCLLWEQQMLQTVIVSLEMGVDCKKISTLDAIDETHNYADMAEQLTVFARSKRTHLIETLAEHIADFIHAHYPTVSHLKLSLEKPGAIPKARTVGVTIERHYA